eukprot:15471262-Alexandrium_andersonii.AAC.1
MRCQQWPSTPWNEGSGRACGRAALSGRACGRSENSGARAWGRPEARWPRSRTPRGWASCDGGRSLWRTRLARL